MTRTRRFLIRRNDEAKAEQSPLSPSVFWICLLLAGLCATLVVAIVVLDVPMDTLGVWPRILIVALFSISVISSLAVTEVIPWGKYSWREWRKPKVLGSVAGLVVSAASLVAGIGPLFDPPSADQETQLKIKRTVEETAKNVEYLTTIRSPSLDDASILNDIGGRWGDIDPACEVIWDIKIVRSGDNAALIAQTVKTPSHVPRYRLVAEVIKAEQNTVHVQGVEPKAARGAMARFDLNKATNRLTWDDRARGAGGVEIYQRCP